MNAHVLGHTADPNEPLSPMEWIAGGLAIAAFLFLLGVCGGIENAAGAEPRRAVPCVVDRATVKGAPATRHQREMISRVLARGVRLRVSRKVQYASVATIIVESEAENISYGDRDSVGLYQIRRMHVRGTDRRMVPEWSAGWFLVQAKNIAYHRPELSTGELAQKVQRSGHPERYGHRVPEARRNVLRWVSRCA